ncbi:MAG TPA: hypothetical protein VFR37_04715 [Longimicrobium sp.]|nr:hypothetical protein [Longimicrobium sp.]
MREAQNETERLLLDVAGRRASAIESITGSAAIHDAVDLFLLVRFELAVLMEDLATPRGSLRASFYGRLLLHTVYESALSLRNLLGRLLREALAATAHLLDLEADLHAVHSRIHRLAQRCIEEYGDIRDAVVAHRDQTAERRIGLLEQVSGLRVLDLALELSQAITEFLQMMLCLLEPARQRTLLPVVWQP